MKDKPAHAIYNTGDHTISLGELADMVSEFLPNAQISFDNETGGRERSGNFMLDNSRWLRNSACSSAPTASASCRS
jgi:hypothetical protein